MRFTFTAAAERALNFASDWHSRTGSEELQPESLLVGLLSESECRAAIMLAQHAIDVVAVCKQWPTLERIERACPHCNGGESPAGDSPCEGIARRRFFSPDVEDAIQSAIARLDFLSPPVELSTEHLLLGLAAADNEVSIWLRERGVDPNAIEAEIRRMHGYEIGEFDVTTGETGLTASLSVEDSGDESPCSEMPTTAEQPSPTDVLRVLDAAANRAREGLRVIEDFVRFVLDDRHLTELCKQTRHDLTAALSLISADARVAARETQEDVGTALTTSAERRRDDLAGVVRANFARLQESLRSLEEFGKLAKAEMAEAFKQLRYRVYTLERAVEITRGSLERFDNVRLYVLADGRATAEDFERLVRSLVEAGVGAIQLRDKRLDDRELLARARLLRTLTRGTKTLCIVNDRPDLAALAGADGVHVGQEELSVKDVRQIVGPEAMIGVSTHCIEQARQAVLDGANYIGVGPTFPSGTKQFEQFPGVELLRAVAAEIRLPAFAIGGITRENVGEVLAAGFSRIAVSGAVASANDPGLAAKQLLETLSNAG